MPRDKHIVTRISLEARNKLAKLSKEKGISNAEIIDRMLGASPEQLAFQKEQLGTTLRKSQWWIKDISEALRQKQSREDTKPPKAVIDSVSLKYLYGSIIDISDKGFGKTLVVDNPGAKQSCGCGTSFSFDSDLWNGNF